MASDPIAAARAAAAGGNAGAGLRLLEAAGEHGDASALLELATWHLRTDLVPRDLPLARQRLRAAAALGDRAAARIEIAFAANGTGAARDWPQALALLREAAARDPDARQQLALLAAMDLDAEGYPASLPPAEMLCPAPAMRRFHGFATHAECAHLARVSVAMLAPAMVTDPATGRLVAHPIRTSDFAVIGPMQEDLVIQALQRRIAAASATALEAGEPIQVLRYAPGQQYRLHSDALPQVANQRVRTAILYLNDGFAGGGTAFPELGITVAAAPGDLLVFDNVLPDGRPDPRARHAGLPVTQGTKWIATRWIRARRLDPWDMATAA